ncbi:glycoside hydrolase superfamily [Collybia nuda]|uniref:Beta-mannosidase A n=1 Tax=Collybia nuda TaxID=64659 RepID=A0A9P5XPN4_9AGAR|nr:glycoside hydrolase superfamily [Collybia nuda]
MNLRDYNVLFLGFIFWSFLVPSVYGSSFDLSQLQWTLKNQNGTIHIPAAGPPSQAHLDLLNAGIITEPLLGINDFTQRWIVEENWTYTADISPFVQTLDPAAHQTTLLIFYGIDTVANISIGNHPVAWVNNEFRHYVFDITPLIASPNANSGDNNLTVSFESAWRYGLNVSTRSDAENFPGGSWFEYPIAYRWTRKTASDFGWDWGPAFVPSGIHKRAYFVSLSSKEGAAFQPSKEDTLQPQELLNPNDSENNIPGAPSSRPKANILGASDEVFVEEFSVDIYKVGQSFSVPPDQNADWAVNVTLALRSGQKIPPGLLTLSFPELNTKSTPFTVPSIPVSSKTPYWISVVWTIPDALPQRWYPHNLGTPKLYNLSIKLDIPKPSDELHARISILNLTTTTGFRTIELIQSPYSRGDVEGRGVTPGDQWHFEVNGKAFYSLGTNIIPFDPFYARITTDKVRWILESAVRSGQNMVRVWGGGAYQPSSADVAGGGYDFYSICDELGILAWSELIFSDTMYGINDFMLETIEPEVRQNVRRINRHPSNAQWAGGNEIEGIAIFDNNSFPNGHRYFNEASSIFVTLFQDFLHDIVVSETKSVPYTDCSTTKGVLSLDPYVLRFNNGTAGEIYGNTEHFNYDASQAFDYSTYPQARFVNEFG